MDQLALVTIVLFIAGLVYSAGAQSQQLKDLREWRNEVRDDLKGIRATLTRVEHLIRGTED